MGDREHRGAQPPEQLPQFDDQPLPQRAVQLSERLVEHQQPGPGRERAGQCDPLLLTARERANGPTAGTRKPDEVEQLPHPLVLLRPRGPVHPQPEGHIGAHVPLWKELMILEHQPDPTLVSGHPALVTPVEQDPAPVERLKAGHHPQQRRLAAAAGPEHTHDLVLGDIETDLVEHGPPAEPYRRVLKAQQHQNSPVRSVRSRSSTSSATAHTTIRIVERAIAWP